MFDDDLWWLWCGTETAGHFVGPHPSADCAAFDRSTSACPHDHAVFRMTLRQMAAKLPAKSRCWGNGVYDPRPTPSRLLIIRPMTPLKSVNIWPEGPLWLYVIKMTHPSKETTCV